MLFHCTDGPAYTSWYSTGVQSVVSYYVDGLNHRDVGPAFVSWDQNGELKVERYLQRGLIHREDGPAETYYHQETPIKLKWMREGVEHRPYKEGPAYIAYLADGTKRVVEAEYRQNGKRPRDLSAWTTDQIVEQTHLLIAAREQYAAALDPEVVYTWVYLGTDWALTPECLSYNDGRHVPVIIASDYSRLAWNGVKRHQDMLAHLTRQIRLRQRELSRRQAAQIC
jgi:hypothetical protein